MNSPNCCSHFWKGYCEKEKHWIAETLVIYFLIMIWDIRILSYLRFFFVLVSVLSRIKTSKRKEELSFQFTMCKKGVTLFMLLYFFFLFNLFTFSWFCFPKFIFSKNVLPLNVLHLRTAHSSLAQQSIENLKEIICHKQLNGWVAKTWTLRYKSDECIFIIVLLFG